MGDDLKAVWGLPFPKLTELKKNETVVIAWIVCKNKAHRNQANAKVMKDPRLAGMCDPKNPPFDMKRMSYGGFKIKVAANQ